MKKYLALILVLVLALSMFACKSNKEPEAAPEQPAAEATAEPTEAPTPEPTEVPAPEWPDTIVDEWVMTLMQEGEFSMNPLNFGMEGRFTFAADGSVLITMTDEEDINGTYAVDGNNVTIHTEDSDITGTYDPEKDAITIAEGSTTLVIERRSNVPEPEKTEAAELVDLTAAEAVGNWELTGVRMGDSVIPASMLGTSMAFVFNADGTGYAISEGQSLDGLSWTIEDGKLALGGMDETLYTMAYDGTALLLEEPDSGMVLVFERTEGEIKIEPVVESADEMVGLWVMSSGRTQGIEVPASMLGMDLAFRFNADGSAAMVLDGETTEGLNWRLENGVVKLSAYGVDLYDLTYDGTSLTLFEEENSVDLIFTKQN